MVFFKKSVTPTGKEMKLSMNIYCELPQNNGRIEMYVKFYIRKSLTNIFLKKVICLIFLSS